MREGALAGRGGGGDQGVAQRDADVVAFACEGQCPSENAHVWS